MILIAAVLLTVGVLIFTVWVRAKDLPEPVPVSPLQHLEERKARIYENLRDLQFEYRVGKLSDTDYQRTKLDLQRELAGLLAEMEKLQPGVPTAPEPRKAAAVQKETLSSEYVCPHCSAKFTKAMKFCGECGKPMTEAAQ
jgi:NADH pyrophosphatase NudC (nudix superfamily)